MASLKLEYPYIKVLTTQEKKDYQSDLPENMDDFEVFHIVTSPLYNDEPYNFFKPQCYWTKEEKEGYTSMFNSSSFWFLFLTGTLLFSMTRSKNLYNTNILNNYKVYSSENWAQYFRRRSYYMASASVLCTHFWYFNGRFSNWPRILG